MLVGRVSWCVDYLRHVAGARTVPVELGARYTDHDWGQVRERGGLGLSSVPVTPAMTGGRIEVELSACCTDHDWGQVRERGWIGIELGIGTCSKFISCQATLCY